MASLLPPTDSVSNSVSSGTPALEAKTERRILARKYRPKFLKDLIGQDLLVQSLTRGLTEQHLPQAILLHGIRGTGKTSTARILARAINCVGPDGKGGMTTTPCGVCRSCKALDEDRHPDVLEMDAASHTGVDDIRDIIDSAQYRAILGRYKVFIIDEVHMLSKSAFNALLKTLEEPPSHVLFIFATTEINKIPETILSRCARFDLKRVDSRVLMNHFEHVASNEGYAIEKDALAILARAADGSVRDGLTLLDQAMNLTDAAQETTITSRTVQSMIGATDRRRLYQVLQKIFAHNPEPLIEDVRALVDAGEDPVAILQDLLECLYRVACFRIMPKLAADDTIPEFERKAAEALAKGTDNMTALSLWKKMLKGYEDVRKAPFAQQALEMTLLRICFAASLPPLETWLKEHPAGEDGKNLLRSSTEASAGFGPQPSAQSGTSTGTTVGESSDLPAETAATEMPASAPSSTLGTQVASVGSAKEAEPNGLTRIASVEDLVAALSAAREALLLGYVQHDMAFVSFQPGHIVLQARGKDAPRAVPMLKQFLAQRTGEKWTVEVDAVGTHPAAQSLHEQAVSQRQAHEAAFQESPLMKQVQDVFPGATVAFQYDE